MPALTASAHQYFRQVETHFGLCQLNLMSRIAVGGTQHGADAGSIKAVGEVMCHQLVGSGNGNGAQLVQT